MCPTISLTMTCYHSYNSGNFPVGAEGRGGEESLELRKVLSICRGFVLEDEERER
jgi:hypothetical protein